MVATVLARVLPILLILVLGFVVRRARILNDQSVDQLRGLVVNVALPAVLFTAFLELDLDPAYAGIFAVISIACVALLGYGYLLRRLFRIDHDYFPFLMTGFEFGMVGITLFGSAYGMASIGYIAIVDLSHELFIWFVLATILAAKRDGAASLGSVLTGFATSPLIISILAALVLNLTGAGSWFVGTTAGASVMQTLQFLGGLLIPLILILIGYGMRLSWTAFVESVPVLAGRLLVLVPLAILINRLVIRRWLSLDPGFEAAIFTFFVLPPPYIVPLFIPSGDEDERTYANNTLSIYTAVSMLLFLAYLAINPVV